LSSAERDRIKQGVLLRAATVGAATATAGSAAAMSLASKVTLIAVATAALGGGAVSLWAWRARPAAPAPVTATPSATTAPVAVPMPAIPKDEVPAVAPSPNLVPSDGIKRQGRRAPAANVSSGGGSSALAGGDVDSELEVLRLARDELRRGQPEEAYRRLLEYDRRRGKGMLAQERRALSAIALCQWRPGREAQTRAAEFLREAPDSPLADRVHLACDGAGTANR
jgi:hypothetical protein